MPGSRWTHGRSWMSELAHQLGHETFQGAVVNVTVLKHVYSRPPLRLLSSSVLFNR